MTALLGNHLWQSTLVVAAVAGFLTLALRRNRPEVRYALWLAASLKFLVPFVLLLALGAQFGWRSHTPATPSQVALVLESVDTMTQPFSTVTKGGGGSFPGPWIMTRVGSIVLAAIWFCGCAAILANWLGRWRRVAAAVRAASPVEHGRDLDALRRLEAIAGITRPIPLVSSNIAIEPGVFGIVTPVLLWPHSIAEHLDEGQVEAILAHELCHVRRRDNLAAAAHMFVEAVFWFHPLVWWLGTRLVDERERACDAEVVRMGSEPQVYAESILKICQFYVESPLVCVAGVTGSSLKKRIEQIMRNDPGRKLNAFKKLLLATAGVAAIAGPVAIGVLNTPRLRAQSSAEALGPPFATTSVKANTSDDPQFYQPTWTPDGTLT